MREQSFNCLLDAIRPEITTMYHIYGSGSITAEIYLHCTLCFLAGGSFHDICVKAKISQPSFYQIVWRTIDAINGCPQLVSCRILKANLRNCQSMGAKLACSERMCWCNWRDAPEDPNPKQKGHQKCKVVLFWSLQHNRSELSSHVRPSLLLHIFLSCCARQCQRRPSIQDGKPKRLDWKPSKQDLCVCWQCLHLLRASSYSILWDRTNRQCA